MTGYERKRSGGGAVPRDTLPAEYAAQRAGESVGGDALHGVQHAGRAAQGSDDQPDQEALRRAGNDVGRVLRRPGL